MKSEIKILTKKLSDFPIELVRKTTSDYNKAFHSKLFTICAAAESELSAFPQLFEPHYDYCFGFHQGEADQWFLDWDGVLKVRHWIIETIKTKGSGPIFELHNTWGKYWHQYEPALREIDSKDLSKLSDADFYSEFENFFIGYLSAGSVAYMADTFMSTGETDWLEDVVSGELKTKEYDQKDISETVRTLINPLIDSYTLDSEWKLIGIGKELEKIYSDKLPDVETLNTDQPTLYRLLEDHSRQFFWINNNYFNVEFLGAEFFYGELRKKASELKVLSSTFKDILDKRTNERASLRLKRDELISKLRLSNFVAELIKVSWLFAEWKDVRKGGSYIGMHYFDLFLNELAHRVPYSKMDLTFLIFQEVKALLFEKVDCKELIEKRKRKTFYAITPKGYFITEGDSADKFFSVEKKEHVEISELRGVSACRGLVKGKVRIVRNTSDMNSFLSGEILVTNQTTPEFVPIMKKAAGIVTEQGGITSHAAIISRELKIPCIIGTKIATQVLRDGDFVEVNADHGVVKIL